MITLYFVMKCRVFSFRHKKDFLLAPIAVEITFVKVLNFDKGD